MLSFKYIYIYIYLNKITYISFSVFEKYIEMWLRWFRCPKKGFEMVSFVNFDIDMYHPKLLTTISQLKYHVLQILLM